MFLILPKVANMGVTDVIVTVFYNVLNGLFLTDNNYYIVMDSNVIGWNVMRSTLGKHQEHLERDSENI